MCVYIYMCMYIYIYSRICVCFDYTVVSLSRSVVSTRQVFWSHIIYILCCLSEHRLACDCTFLKEKEKKLPSKLSTLFFPCSFVCCGVGVGSGADVFFHTGEPQCVLISSWPITPSRGSGL